MILKRPWEEGGPVGLAVVLAVVALADEDGQELGTSAEVSAALAGRFQAAVQFRGAGAPRLRSLPGLVRG